MEKRLLANLCSLLRFTASRPSGSRHSPTGTRQQHTMPTAQTQGLHFHRHIQASGAGQLYPYGPPHSHRGDSFSADNVWGKEW
jgi:hypothetical protein